MFLKWLGDEFILLMWN